MVVLRKMRCPCTRSGVTARGELPRSKPSSRLPPRSPARSRSDEIVAAVDRYSWRTDDVKRLLAAHGFAKSSQVTVDKLPAILDALKNGAVVAVTPQVGVVAPENAHVV